MRAQLDLNAVKHFALIEDLTRARALGASGA
jgi:hypothetical protein